MFGALWRFLVYRVLGGRVLLALTVLGWLRALLLRRRQTPAPPPSVPVSSYPPSPPAVASPPQDSRSTR
jgi:hypothetical protein